MRYYDTCIGKKVIRNYTYYSLIEQKRVPAEPLTIEITRETPQFLYGISWNGRWKYNKKTDTWYHYEKCCWWEENGEYTLES